VIDALRPEWVVGVGGFAFARVEMALQKFPGLKGAQILHPSPASPAANRGWAQLAGRQLEQAGIWPRP
jgi:single-strand selective monofunctional uracil DNA glycosylase